MPARIMAACRFLSISACRHRSPGKALAMIMNATAKTMMPIEANSRALMVLESGTATRYCATGSSNSATP